MALVVIRMLVMAALAGKCRGFQTSFGDNSGMYMDGGEDYTADTTDVLMDNVVRLTTTTSSGTIEHHVITHSPAVMTSSVMPSTTSSTTPPPTTSEPPQVDVRRLENSTSVNVSCEGPWVTISASDLTSDLTSEITSTGSAEVNLTEVVEEGVRGVAVVGEGCERLVVGGSLPASVDTLTLGVSGGLTLTSTLWSLTHLSVRARGGLIVPDNLCDLLPPSLTSLDISRATMTSLNIGDCTNLTRLHASHSDLTSIGLCTPSLTSLHVPANNLTSLDTAASCTGGLEATANLYASHNHLTSFTTCNWPNLQLLDLRHNDLTSLDLTTCPPRNLTNLLASRNRLARPPVLAASLLHADLSRNQLVDLPALTHDLLSLDASHNAVAEVGKHRFKRARRLSVLSLAYNHLTHLHVHDLAGLRSLRTLDLSHNRLREIHPGTFRHLRHLHRLHLQHNHLSTLDARDLAALTPSAYASLHHNPWDCTCSLLLALQELHHCEGCPDQELSCKESGEWLSASGVLDTCNRAVKTITQHLQDESDEDFSEEDPDDGPEGSQASEGGAVMVVPGLVILLVAAVGSALSYKLCRKHRSRVRATIEPFCCNCCAASGTAGANVNHNHHSLHHTHLSHQEHDSDTETEL